MNRLRDKLGRITQKVETIQSATHTYDYAYDLAGRLASVTLDGSALASWTWDANGNRLSATTSSGTTSCVYDEQDRLASCGQVTFTRNLSGQLTERSDATAGTTTQYQYDMFGNLRHVELADGTQIDYLIDNLNRRIGKKVNGSLVRGLLYQGDLQPVAELDAAGNIVSTFVYAARSHVPSYMLKDGQVYRIISDHLGSPRLVINAASGTVAQRMDYDAWGKVILDTNPGFQPFGFAGGLYDRDTGLTRFGARDYNPATGRWTTKDPILFNGGDTNLYGYVGNDPVNTADPSGLVPWDKLHGLPKKFWHWLHTEENGKLINHLKDETGNVPEDVAKDYHKEWEDLGKPNPRKERGFIDIDLLMELLIPWPLTPSELACGELDCNSNGIPDFEEQSVCK